MRAPPPIPFDAHRTGERLRVFGRYLLLRRLSRGGMGEVFLAKTGEIQGFEKVCIIKKVLPHLSADREFTERFVEEAKIAINLAHANIAAVYEVGRVDGDYFLAMEYVHGRDLRFALSRAFQTRAEIPPDVCLFVAREVASGLAYAHRRTDDRGNLLGLVHCDVSPPNILLSFEGEVKLIDFGIARSARRELGDGARIGFGKHGYMAPEQLVAGQTIDRRTDVYATGVVLYEMLTCDRLFNFAAGTDWKTIARRVTAGVTVPPSERNPALGKSLDDLVMRALRPDPKDRFQSAEELRDAIQQRLYALNPTLSADRVGLYVRELFTDELESERSILRSATATSLAPYLPEISDARTHTVSFAMATTVEVPPLAPPATAAAAEVAAAVPGSGLLPTQAPQRRGVVLGLSTAVGVLLVLLAIMLLSPPTRIVPADGSVRPPAPTSPLPPAVPAPPGSGTAVQSAPAPRLPQVASGPDAQPAAAPAGGGEKRTRPHADASSRRAAHASAPDVAEVQEKFRRVKQDYEQFKQAFGPRLDAQWSNILFLITYGKEGKYDKLDRLLGEMERSMARVRSEEGAR